MDDRGGEAEDRASDRAAAGDEFQREVRADYLQAGLGGQAVELVGALAAVGEVPGRAVDLGQAADGLQVAVAVDDPVSTRDVPTMSAPW